MSFTSTSLSSSARFVVARLLLATVLAEVGVATLESMPPLPEDVLTGVGTCEGVATEDAGDSYNIVSVIAKPWKHV